MDWNEYFFRHVFLAASKSKDTSSKIGAVLVKDNVIISEGYNGFPREVADLESRIKDRDTKLAFTVHAEHNAILNCARNGVSTLGSVCFTSAFPCEGCMKSIIQAGIKTVVCHKVAQDYFYKRATTTNWNDMHKNSETMSKEAGVRVWYWDGKLGLETLIGGNVVKV